MAKQLLTEPAEPPRDVDGSLFEAKATLTAEKLISGGERVIPGTEWGRASSNVFNFSGEKVDYYPGTKSLETSVDCRSDKKEYKVQANFYNIEDDNDASLSGSPVRVRCSCAAYYFYFWYANKQADALLGRNAKPYVPVKSPKRYVPPRNPDNTPGVCKHLVAWFRALNHSGVVGG